MALNPRFSPVLPLLVAAALAASGCSTERDTAGLQPEPLNPDPTVFLDGFTEGLDYQAFLGSYLEALSIETDPSETYRGPAALRFTVPRGQWAGGAFPNSRVRDLSGYDALTFWAKSSDPTATSVDILGFGNNNTGDSKYVVARIGLELTTEYEKYIVPIPLPSRLRGEDGLFYFADSDPQAETYHVWFDEVRFEKTGVITNPRPSMRGQAAETFVGLERVVRDTRTTFNVDGEDQTIEHSPGYFTFFSSNEAVATVGKHGTIRTHAAGTTTITAKLGDVDVSGSVTLEVRAPDPTKPAPTPPHPPGNVISLYSNAYPAAHVDAWSTSWDTATSFDLRIDGDDVKVYEFDNLGGFAQPYAAIEFANPVIDAEAAGMTHLHLDLWIPGAFWVKIKLVDFGSDGLYTSGSTPQVTPCDPAAPEEDISQHEAQLLIDDPDVSGVWAQVDLPLSDFLSPDIRGDCLRSTAHLAQLIIQVANGTEYAYVDNVYFYK